MARVVTAKLVCLFWKSTYFINMTLRRCVCVRAAVFYRLRVFHQTAPQQTRHHLQLLLGLLDVGVQLEDFLQVAAGRQVVLPQRWGRRGVTSKSEEYQTAWEHRRNVLRHLQTLVSQRSSVEGLLVARLQLQSRVTVPFGLFKAIQFQEANGSGEQQKHGIISAIQDEVFGNNWPFYHIRKQNVSECVHGICENVVSKNTHGKKKFMRNVNI